MHPRYAWLGSTRRQLLRDVLASCADAWLQDWCLQREALAVEITEIESAGWPVHDSIARGLESERGSVLGAVRERQIETLGMRFASAGSGGALASPIAGAALEDLVMRIAACARLGGEVLEWKSTWPESITRPEWGALGILVKLDDLELLIAIDRTAAEAISPAVVAPAVLEERIASLRTTQVPITAVLDFGEISARDLAGLHIGEVLVSECQLGQNVFLRTGKTHLANATLGRADNNHLAVVLTAATGFQENP